MPQEATCTCRSPVLIRASESNDASAVSLHPAELFPILQQQLLIAVQQQQQQHVVGAQGLHGVPMLPAGPLLGAAAGPSMSMLQLSLSPSDMCNHNKCDVWVDLWAVDVTLVDVMLEGHLHEHFPGAMLTCESLVSKLEAFVLGSGDLGMGGELSWLPTGPAPRQDCNPAALGAHMPLRQGPVFFNIADQLLQHCWLHDGGLMADELAVGAVVSRRVRFLVVEPPL